MELQRGHRSREPALLGDGAQFRGPLPVPPFWDGVAPVDALRGEWQWQREKESRSNAASIEEDHRTIL
jgi:hypothetical protein